MKKHSLASKGFTLIELMVVVAVIAILGAIALPRFGDMLLRSKESTAKGALGSFRSTLDIYYVAMEGSYPTDTNVLPGNYVDFLPEVQIPPVPSQGNPGHHSNSRVQNYLEQTLFGTVNEGTNIWAYVNSGTDTGHVGFNCMHKDSQGNSWSQY
ncbi:MAG TPA: prepilin-type N-terminal cleavage/methylation domain-containing protein [Elusimicrobiota bacterium]|nr:prepilin-type N-terminal cleavage/methylation domain-containing protein [Elusimicrobiota bacterium]